MSSYISLPTYAASLGQRLRLEAGVCLRCGMIAYPRRNHCLACNGIDFAPTALSGAGEIYTFTIIAAGGAPAEFDQQQTLTGVIAVGIIQLKEGPRVIGQILTADPEALSIGTPVTTALRRLYDQEGVVRYGLKFTPCVAAPGT
jgi:uncharacterized OB-fold protein